MVMQAAAAAWKGTVRVADDVDYEDETALTLLSEGKVEARDYDVWYAHHVGLYGSGFAICRHFGLSGRHIRRIAATVEQAIANRQAYEQTLNCGRKGVGGHSTHSGSRCRRVGDPTAQGQLPISSWNEEQLRRYGLLDRWSKKR